MSKTEEIKMDEMETLAEAIVEAEEAKEEKIEEKIGFFTKAKNFTKKHGKKILVAGLIAGAGALGYSKGKKLSNFEEDFDYDSDDIVDVSSDDGAVDIEEN